MWYRFLPCRFNILKENSINRKMAIIDRKSKTKYTTIDKEKLEEESENGRYECEAYICNMCI